MDCFPSQNYELFEIFCSVSNRLQTILTLIDQHVGREMWDDNNANKKQFKKE